MADRTAQRLERVATIALGLPEVERFRHPGSNHVGFNVGKQKVVWVLDDHHGNGRVELQTRGAPGENAVLVEAHPDRYFMPPYMARHGWIGLWFDLPKVDWDEVESLIVASYRIQAPKRLVKLLDG